MSEKGWILIELLSLDDLLKKLVRKAKEEFGGATYKYYAIPVSWKSGRYGGHTRPITGLERFEITKEVWEKNKEESRRKRTAAFIGKYRGEYTDYEKHRTADGWKEKLIALINDFES